MNANFLCPHCRAFLNVGNQIVISAKNQAGKRGLLFLSIQLGDYKVIKHDFFELEDQEVLKMSCPACHKNLRVAEIHKNICKILMQDEEDQEFAVLFSGVYGEKCTYKIRDNVVESYGKHASKYIDIENLSGLI
ncbi:MAG: hypothetical protein ACEPOZ_21820 [Marinifilaceae bacterium]